MTHTILPAAPTPITKRPKDMLFEEYRELRAKVNKQIKKRLQQGFLVHLSNELMLDAKGRPVAMRFGTGKTLVGSTKFLPVI